MILCKCCTHRGNRKPYTLLEKGKDIKVSFGYNNGLRLPYILFAFIKTKKYPALFKNFTLRRIYIFGRFTLYTPSPKGNNVTFLIPYGDYYPVSEHVPVKLIRLYEIARPLIILKQTCLPKLFHNLTAVFSKSYFELLKYIGINAPFAQIFHRILAFIKIFYINV